MTLFSNLLEECMEIFMDDFSVFGPFFDKCLSNLNLVLKRCRDTNLVLNWEKCQFMIKECIVLGHKVSQGSYYKATLPHQGGSYYKATLSHQGGSYYKATLPCVSFYRRFVKNFPKIAKPMTNLLAKDVELKFSDAYLKAFELLKEKLTSALVVEAPDQTSPFELMCNSIDTIVGAMLGQRKDKVFHTIYYASRTLNEAQRNYTTTEKELLVVQESSNKIWCDTQSGHTVPPLN
ncbi:Retrovirus-related Pol polyprotein from transposon 17.6, partial [Mucuna pruriens]